MKRCILAMVVVFTVLAFAAPAQALAPADSPVSGSVSGNDGTFRSDPCGGFHQTVTAAGDLTPFGASNVALDFCSGTVYDGLHSIITSGAFTLTAVDGTVSGPIGGWVQPGVPVNGGYPFELVLTVTGGSGRYAGATGTITLDGLFGIAAQALNGTASGSIGFGSATKDDCKDGGWRTLVNSQGEHYRNQGACVSSLVHQKH
jgi:hypothetical protein